MQEAYVIRRKGKSDVYFRSNQFGFTANISLADHYSSKEECLKRGFPLLKSPTKWELQKVTISEE